VRHRWTTSQLRGNFLNGVQHVGGEIIIHFIWQTRLPTIYVPKYRQLDVMRKPPSGFEYHQS
jgi:hypothetical protein